MKKLVIVAIAIINCFVSLAQSRVEPVEFQKIPRQAAVMEYPFSTKTTQAAIYDKFTKLGYKSKETKVAYSENLKTFYVAIYSGK